MKPFKIESIENGVMNMRHGEETRGVLTKDYDAELGFEVGGVVFLNDDNTVQNVLSRNQADALAGLVSPASNEAKKKNEPKTSTGAGQGSTIGDKFAKPARF